jgi:hypothetical protein
MSKESLENIKKQELVNPFPLLKELFDYVESQGFDETSFSEYDGETDKKDIKNIILPEKFKSLIPNIVGDFFIVAYENRRDSYYKEGTRSRMVRLSTVRQRSKSDEKIREIELSEPDISEGNVMHIKIRDSVNNKSFMNINTAGKDEVEMPHGSAELMYEISNSGEKKMKESIYRRLDEGLFEWKGKNQSIRWIRSIDTKIDTNVQESCTYEDSMIIGRWQLGKPDERSQ